MKNKEFEHFDVSMERILRTQRDVLINYLFMKQQSEDWHGVADAAMDLRELDVRLKVLKGE